MLILMRAKLKIYFRDLPQPLIPTEIYSECLLAAGHINMCVGFDILDLLTAHDALSFSKAFMGCSTKCRCFTVVYWPL